MSRMDYDQPCNNVDDDEMYYYQMGIGTSYHVPSSACMAAFNDAIIAFSTRLNTKELSNVEEVCRKCSRDSEGRLNANILIGIRKDQIRQDTVQTENAETPSK